MNPTAIKPEAINPKAIRDDIAALLGIDAATIDDADDLIGVGLDSIRMMRLAGGWRKRGHDISFADLAATPTVAAWAALLAPTSTPDAPAPITWDETDWQGDDFPLAPMQHAYWVGRTGSTELGGVAAHLYVEFDGANLDAERLAAAAETLAQRHHMLRARFTADGRQIIDPSLRRPALVVDDQRGAAADELATLLADRRSGKSHQVLDVASGE
ncbi:MAG: phosphopantetheine-binding protein, partial [Gordonia sp. (in: high G+C Gram-positive bacteria)]